MPYVKNDPPWVNGGAPGISAERLNHMETQYDEAKADLDAHRTATTLDHPDGSVTAAKLGANAVTTDTIADNAVTAAKLGANAVTAGKIADGAVDTLARIAAGVRTTPGGTECGRLAVTHDTTGRVGDTNRLEGKHWVTVASGSIAVGANTTVTMYLRSGGAHNHYLVSVYSARGEVLQHYPRTTDSRSWQIWQRPAGYTEYMAFHNGTSSSETFYYSVLAWE